MQFTTLACDYDGTIAAEGRVSDTTLKSLKQCAASGRKLILVTGRELPELLDVCHCLQHFPIGGR